jgi:fluoride exporter
MRMIWYVAMGGAVGSVARYLLSILIQTRSGTEFPLGTLLINISGSLLLGFLLRYALDSAAISPEFRALATTGFCGGYTTFSAFSYETVMLIDAGDWKRASLYVTLSVVGSVLGAFLGIAGARELLTLRRAL